MFCTHPFIVDGRRGDPALISVKYQRLCEIVEEIVLHQDKFIVFTTFNKMNEILSEDLGHRFRIPVWSITGKIKVDERQNIIDEFIAAPRRAADERYRLGTKKKVEQAAQNAHDTSNKVIDSKAAEVQQSTVSITDASNNEVMITNREGTFKHKLVICKPEKPGQVRIVPVDSIDDGMLWEPCMVEGKTAIRLNCSHQFYHKVYVPNLSSGVLVQGMDALIWSLGVAELSTFNKDTREQYEELRLQVSRSLRKLVADLPEPELDNGDET